MYLHILILAELTSGPAHGYELRKRIRKTLGGSVDINSNTIYPALRRFQEDGCVVEYEDQLAGYPPKYVYQITEPGRRELHEMLTAFGPTRAQNDKEFLTRVAFFGLLSREERQDILDIRGKALDARRSYLENLEHELNDVTTPSDSGAYSKINHEWQNSVLNYCRAQLMAEFSWLADLRDASVRTTSEAQD
jgi:DNA-binding PadR family transcriptional regulator